MADNVAITAGSGTSIGTDDVSGVHYQKMKLFDGTADSTNAAIVDSSGNLQVEVTNSGITGTAGTPNSAVLSVQGITSGTAIPISDNSSSITVDQGTAASLNMTEANSGSIKTAVELIDDGVYTSGSGTPSKGMLALGTDGTNPRSIKTDTSGELQVDVLTVPNRTVAQMIQWSNYSNHYTSAQTSQDLVAASGSTKIYIGRITVTANYNSSQAGRTTVQVYFGTGAVSDTSKHVFRGTFITVPGTSLESYPGVVIGNGAAPFCISAASDALKITTTTSGTHCGIAVQVDYIQV